VRAPVPRRRRGVPWRALTSRPTAPPARRARSSATRAATASSGDLSRPAPPAASAPASPARYMPSSWQPMDDIRADAPGTPATLETLGWDERWADAFAPHAGTGRRPARVVLEHQHIYRVHLGDGDVLARVTG